eukprot:TRINITY_DN928_c0_g1_i1.p1 TRINITY_DN928_c0_g1~~TRINITY_DN928_c0_g1_i1.p1  ORF type:complete len:883 (+),score=180.85 TRINITY_DN928_c0_g1_i1:35-2650(+)
MEAQEEITLNLKTLDSRVFQLHVHKDIPINQLKESIEKETQVSAGVQRLIFQGKILKDDTRLSSYGISDGQTIHLVERPPGTIQNPRNDEPQQQQNQNVPRVSNVLMGAISIPNDQPNDINLNQLVSNVISTLGMGTPNATPETTTNTNIFDRLNSLLSTLDGSVQAAEAESTTISSNLNDNMVGSSATSNTIENLGAILSRTSIILSRFSTQYQTLSSFLQSESLITDPATRSSIDRLTHHTSTATNDLISLLDVVQPFLSSVRLGGTNPGQALPIDPPTQVGITSGNISIHIQNDGSQRNQTQQSYVQAGSSTTAPNTTGTNQALNIDLPGLLANVTSAIAGAMTPQQQQQQQQQQQSGASTPTPAPFPSTSGTGPVPTSTSTSTASSGPGPRAFVYSVNRTQQTINSPPPSTTGIVNGASTTVTNTGSTSTGAPPNVLQALLGNLAQALPTTSTSAPATTPSTTNTSGGIPPAAGPPPSTPSNLGQAFSQVLGPLLGQVQNQQPPQNPQATPVPAPAPAPVPAPAPASAPAPAGADSLSNLLRQVTQMFAEPEDLQPTAATVPLPPFLAQSSSGASGSSGSSSLVTSTPQRAVTPAAAPPTPFSAARAQPSLSSPYNYDVSFFVDSLCKLIPNPNTADYESSNDPLYGLLGRVLQSLSVPELIDLVVRGNTSHLEKLQGPLREYLRGVLTATNSLSVSEYSQKLVNSLGPHLNDEGLPDEIRKRVVSGHGLSQVVLSVVKERLEILLQLLLSDNSNFGESIKEWSSSLCLEIIHRLSLVLRGGLTDVHTLLVYFFQERLASQIGRDTSSVLSGVIGAWIMDKYWNLCLARDQLRRPAAPTGLSEAYLSGGSEAKKKNKEKPPQSQSQQ